MFSVAASSQHFLSTWQQPQHQGSKRVFICVAPFRAQSCAKQHRIWVMNGGYSLVYKISHLNKISRSNILNKALRQPRARLMFLGRRLRHTRTEKDVPCSEQQHAVWFTGNWCRGSKSRANYTAGLPWSFLKNLAVFFFKWIHVCSPVGIRVVCYYFNLFY